MRRWDRLLETYMDEYRARRICQATVAATESRLHLCMPPAPPPRPMQPFSVAATPKIHFPLPQALTETGPSAARAAGLTLIPGKDHGVAPTTRPPLRQHDARSLTLRRTGRAKNRNKKSATWSQSRNRTLPSAPPEKIFGAPSPKIAQPGPARSCRLTPPARSAFSIPSRTPARSPSAPGPPASV